MPRSSSTPAAPAPAPEQSEPFSSTTAGTLSIERSVSFKYADGTLDNMKVCMEITLDGDLDDQDRIGGALESISLALGQPISLDDKTGTMVYGKPTFNYTAPSPSSGGGASNSGRGSAGRSSSGGRGGFSSNAPRGGGGGGQRKPNYSEEETEMHWNAFFDSPDNYWDNLNHESYPNIKPKGDDNAKPLYLKSAPEWVSEELNK